MTFAGVPSQAAEGVTVHAFIESPQPAKRGECLAAKKSWTFEGTWHDTDPRTGLNRPPRSLVLEIDSETRRKLDVTTWKDPYHWSVGEVDLGETDSLVSAIAVGKTFDGQATQSRRVVLEIDGEAPKIWLRARSASGVDLQDNEAPPMYFSPVRFYARTADSSRRAPPKADLLIEGKPYEEGGRFEEEGEHLIVASVRDCAGHLAVTSLRFQVDASPPILLSIEPADKTAFVTRPGSIVGQSQPDLARATVNRIEARVENGRFELTPFPSKEGVNNLEIELTDEAGRTGSFRSSFTVRTTGTKEKAALLSRIADASPEDAEISFVRIPAGSFMMGCSVHYLDCHYSEYPKHQVRISRPFEMATTETTYDQFDRCIAAGVCREPWHRPQIESPHPGTFPVTFVTWTNARDFCEWIGGRLPTEAEWEYAARGGLEGSTFPWGNEDPVCRVGAPYGARFRATGVGRAGRECPTERRMRTDAVGSYPANGLRLFDVAGNVSEYVADEYGPYPKDTVGELVDPGPYSADDVSLAMKPSGMRVIRGGSWAKVDWSIRVSSRSSYSAREDTSGQIGFRCARPLPEEGGEELRN